MVRKRSGRGTRKRQEKTVAQRRADHMRSAVRYFREPQWSDHPDRIVKKSGRLATRLLAANQVLKEIDGLVLLGPSVESALKQLVHPDQRVQ